MHIMVYLAEKFGRPGLSQSSPFAVSESQTQHPHSRKTELTMIRKTANDNNWTQDLLSGNQGEGQRGALQGWLSRGCSPDPRSRCCQSKSHEHGSIQSRS